MHDELGLFVRAGLSPAEALRTATLNAAEFLGRRQDFGTVEQDKLADLVLLNGNPLENIGNTRQIEAVVVSGRLLSKADLKQLLDRVEAQATSPRLRGASSQ